jgi:hypothetical protein
MLMKFDTLRYQEKAFSAAWRQKSRNAKEKQQTKYFT